LQECHVINEDDSRWILKVGVGGLVRTVTVQVHVDAWDGPARAVFSYKLEGDPVEGGGTYLATTKSASETDVALTVRVVGSGTMAPMWEAMGKPLLPKFVKAFAEQLKEKIEAEASAAAPVSLASNKAPSLWARIWQILGAIFGQKNKPATYKRRRSDERT
jgi:hypothetical protein